MPYIAKSHRKAFDSVVNSPTLVNMSHGEFNYVISAIIANQLKFYGTTYTHINALIGILECVKLELYRRVAAPYEDEKQRVEGDVYV